MPWGPTPPASPQYPRASALSLFSLLHRQWICHLLALELKIQTRHQWSRRPRRITFVYRAVGLWYSTYAPCTAPEMSPGYVGKHPARWMGNHPTRRPRSQLESIILIACQRSSSFAWSFFTRSYRYMRKYVLR